MAIDLPGWCIVDKLIPVDVRGQIQELSESILVETLEQSLASVPPSYEDAVKACAALIIKDPQNPTFWSQFSESCFLMIPSLPEASLQEEWSQATSLLLQTAILVDTEEKHPRNYFYYGQLSDGVDALQAYKKGFDVTFNLLQSQLVGPEAEDTRRRCADFCAEIANLYMTDLCDNEEAETSVLESLKKGKEVDPSNFSIAVLLAGYYRIVEDFEKAKVEAETAVTLLKAYIRLFEGDDEEDEAAPGALPPVPPAIDGVMHQELPDFEVQLQLSRLLVDLGLLDEAVDTLQFMIEQNERDDRVFHRLAIAHMLNKEYDIALECVDRLNELVEAGHKDRLDEVANLRSEIVRRREAEADS